MQIWTRISIADKQDMNAESVLPYFMLPMAANTLLEKCQVTMQCIKTGKTSERLSFFKSVYIQGSVSYATARACNVIFCMPSSIQLHWKHISIRSIAKRATLTQL